VEESAPRYIAFDGSRRIAAGPLRDVARKVKETHDARPESRILVFNATTSELLDLDLRGTAAQVLRRLPVVDKEIASPADPVQPESPAPSGPGRPRLGVVAREVTLLPRHWEWLKTQPGGASVALRKLVEQARRASASADRVRQSQNATYQFMSVMAGNLEGFEEASRALFAADLPRFEALVAAWPVDIREHVCHLAETAFHVEINQVA
jgi:hypothetical protein